MKYKTELSINRVVCPHPRGLRGGGGCLSSLKQYAKININQVRMALFLSGDIHEGNRSAVLVFDIELGIETIS